MGTKVKSRTISKSFRLEKETADKLYALSQVYKVSQAQLVTEMIQSLYSDCTRGERNNRVYDGAFCKDMLQRMCWRLGCK